jgi:hypothetical protein
MNLEIGLHLIIDWFIDLKFTFNLEQTTSLIGFTEISLILSTL